jgi:putative tryptophan/tyrosine transport system substrate-binding protein
MDGSSGPDLPDRYRHVADYVSKILRGAPPGDLPVQRPEKFQLVVNLKTARALKRTLLQSLVPRGDRVIESAFRGSLSPPPITGTPR